MGKPIDVAPYYLISLVFMASMPSLSQAISCMGSAKYTLTFKAEWRAASHPDFPPSPHFSRLVGCSHNASYVMWRPGVNATLGVQDVAEKGSISEMNNELDQQISLKTALAKFQGGGISNVGTRTVNNIPVNRQYPLVSAISMIAPSPDWFVGVRDYSLCNETTGKWIDKRVKSLALYDSGTDSAPRFSHTNTPTEPHVPIFLLDNTHEGSLKSNETTKPFGTFTFEKTFDSNPLPTSTATSPIIVASMVPPRKSSMVPPRKSSMVPAEMASMVRAVESSMVPAEMTSMVPTVKSSMVPAEMASMVRAVESSMVPPRKSSMVPAEMASMVRAVESSMVPAEMASMVLAVESSMVPTGKSSMVPTVESSMVPTEMASTKSGMTQVNMASASSVTHSRGPTQSSTKSGACSFVYQSISVSLKLIISGMLTMYII